MEVLDGPFKLFLSTFTENITHTLFIWLSTKVYTNKTVSIVSYRVCGYSNE